MGGDNTITELIALQKHPSVIPRESPTSEQYIRAYRLNTLSLVSIVDLVKKDELKNSLIV